MAYIISNINKTKYVLIYNRFNRQEKTRKNFLFN